MFTQGSGFWCGTAGRWLASCLLGLCVSSTGISLDAAAAPHEGELRAAVIVAIMRFTTWNTIAIEKPVLDVCLAGRPISTGVLLSVSGEQKVATRTLEVRSIGRKVDSCDVLVIGENVSDDEFEHLLAQAGGGAILTVCDGCRRGLAEDTIIQLRLRQQRVSFEVNLTRARSSGVSLDAQLLELATVVRR